MGRTALSLLVVLAAAGAAGVPIALAYRRDLALARDRATCGGRIVNTSAGPIEYGDEGAGVALLSIHGAGGGFDQGLANVVGLVGDGFRIIAPSRFGYLGTPIPADTSVAAQADAHATLLDELGVDKAVVVGVSAGARSATELAIRHPDRVTALVLIVPGTYAPTSAVAVDGSRTSSLVLRLVNNGADVAWWAAEKIAPSVLIRFVGVPPGLVAAAPKAEQDRVLSIIRSIEPLSRRLPGIQIDSNPESRRPRFEDIAAPALVVSARDDLFNTLPAAEFAAATIPNARLAVYETGGHLLVGRQRDVHEVIKGFISQRRR